MVLNHGLSTNFKPVPGFTIALPDWGPTIATLWDAVKGNGFRLYTFGPFFLASELEFAQDKPQYIAANNSMDFLSDNGGQTYNLCHCKPREFGILYRPLAYFYPQFGPISKLLRLTFGEVSGSPSCTGNDY